MKKNLILAMGTGYTEKEFAPFFNSLNQSGYTGDLFFIAQEKDANALSNFSRRGNIKIHLFSNQKPMHKATVIKIGRIIDFACIRYPILRKLSVKLREKFAIKNSCVIVQRHFLFRDILNLHADEYQTVMMTDARDVVFQRDPFDFDIQPESINYFLEPEYTRIQDCQTNSKWIRWMLGEDALKRLGPHYISCAGTIIGCTKLMQVHNKILTESLIHNLRNSISGGLDQALHNSIVWDKLVPNSKRIPNRAGIIITMHHMKRAEWTISDDGLIMIAGNKIPNTVHQYDRHPEANKAILSRYT